MPDHFNRPVMQRPATKQQHPPATLLKEAIMGFRTTQLISVAAKMNLAEYLKDGPKTTEQLAESVNAHPGSLARLLRALSDIGIFEQKDDDSFCNTPTAELLLETAPGSLRSLAVLYGEDWLWRAYAGLSYSVETGKPAFDVVHGETLYGYLDQHPAAALVFDKAMSGYSESEAAAVIEAYDFSGRGTVMDIGGGQGVFVSALLKEKPLLSGIVFDLPQVIENRPEQSGSKAGRITFVAGNFFKDVPGGADVYFLKSVLHNWDDTSCIRILRNCRKVMMEKTRLLVLERVIPGNQEKSESKLFDINMLVVTGGSERTANQYRQLFNNAGFNMSRILSTRSPLSIIEGIPIG